MAMKLVSPARHSFLTELPLAAGLKYVSSSRTLTPLPASAGTPPAHAGRPLLHLKFPLTGKTDGLRKTACPEKTFRTEYL